MTQQDMQQIGILALAVALLALALSAVAVLGQDKGRPNVEIALVGQLATDDAGAYVLIERGSGDAIALVSSEDLDEYLGKRVQVVGTWAEDAEGFRYFVVDRVSRLT